MASSTSDNVFISYEFARDYKLESLLFQLPANQSRNFFTPVTVAKHDSSVTL